MLTDSTQRQQRVEYLSSWEKAQQVTLDAERFPQEGALITEQRKG